MPSLNMQRRIASLLVADENTWNAINIAEPSVEGWIFGADVYDITTGEDFIYSEKSGRNPFPVQIPYGHTISVAALCENTGSGNQHMVLTVELIDPDGIVRSSHSASGTLPPEAQMSSGNTPNIVPDKYGTWMIHALLEAEPA